MLELTLHGERVPEVDAVEMAFPVAFGRRRTIEPGEHAIDFAGHARSLGLVDQGLEFRGKGAYAAAVEPELRRVVPAMRAVFAIGSILVAAAGIQLFILTDHTERYFAWTVAPGLSAAFLGAFYFTALVLAAGSAKQDEWSRVRVGVFGVWLFVTLTLVTTLLHLDKFHFHASVLPKGAAWLWSVIYVVAPIAVAYALVLQRRAPGIDRPRTRPLPRWYRALLSVQSLVILIVGLRLFLGSTSTSWWPWQLTPLVAQAMASWLLGLGVVLATGVWENDWLRIRIASISYVVLATLQLIGMVRYAGQLRGGLSARVYLTALILIFASGALGVTRADRASRPALARPPH
jgi:hypothetical protein